MAWARVPPAVVEEGDDAVAAAEPERVALSEGPPVLVADEPDIEPEPEPRPSVVTRPDEPGEPEQAPEPPEPPGPRQPVARPRPDHVPHVRLGILWAMVLGGAVAAGPAGIAVVLAVVAAMAAIEVARAHGVRPPLPPAAGVAAAVVVFTALAGGRALVFMTGAVVVLVLAALAVARGTNHAWAVVGVALALAPASVVYLAGRSMVIAGVLLVAACLYDAGSYLVGTGSANRWEGPAAGVVSLIPFVVIVASAFDPPFRHSSGWVFGAAMLVLAPIGPALARRLTGSSRGAAVRRLDVLLLTAPVWAILAAVLTVG